MLKKREVMIFLVEDRAGEQAVGSAALFVMYIYCAAKSSALQLVLARAVSCMLLHIKRYIVFMKFFTGHLTIENPPLTAGRVEAQPHFFFVKACKWETHVHQ